MFFILCVLDVTSSFVSCLQHQRPAVVESLLLSHWQEGEEGGLQLAELAKVGVA